MTQEIEKVIAAIRGAGGRMGPRHLLDVLIAEGLNKQDVQLAVQTAFDKGLLMLDRDMQFVVVQHEEYEAA